MTIDGRNLELINDGMGFIPREHAIVDSPRVAALHREPAPLVKIACELLTSLAAGWSPPVELMAVPLPDGTWELIGRTPVPADGPCDQVCSDPAAHAEGGHDV